MEEQERIKNLVDTWEVKPKGTEEELGFVEKWLSMDNLLIFGIDE
jgi:hypothetical protein